MSLTVLGAIDSVVSYAGVDISVAQRKIVSNDKLKNIKTRSSEGSLQWQKLCLCSLMSRLPGCFTIATIFEFITRSEVATGDGRG